MSIPHLPKNISAEWELNSKLWQTWDYLYMVKGEAFREEREWRLVVTALQQNDAPPFQFRLSRGIVIPFLEYTMPDRSDHNGISHVYLGPRNRTPRYIVKMMLNQFDLKDVTICNSQASYR